MLLLVAAAWLAFRGWQAQRHLTAARSALASVSAVDDPVRAQQALQQAARETREARKELRDPLWSLMGRVPYLGEPFRTAAAISEVTDGLVRTTLPPVVEAAKQLADVKQSGKATLPLTTFAATAGPLARADQALVAAAYALAHLPSGLTVGPVERARRDLLTQVNRIAGPVHDAAVVARLAPDMLGAKGTRRYFVAFENRAELRPDGGLIGGFAEVAFTSGRLQVVRFGQNGDLPALTRVPPTLDPTFVATYGNRGAGEQFVNTNLSPHFPDDARAWAAMYQAGTRRTIDGVLALDAAGLAGLAGLTGQPIVVPGTAPVAAADLADFLERREYALGLSRDPRKQVVADVGRQTLERLQGAGVRARSVLTLFGTLAKAGHVHLTSTHPEEQAALEGYPLAGIIRPTHSPYAGVFLTNAAGSKLDAYVRERVLYEPPFCRSAGSSKVTVTLENTAPTGLPDYVTYGVTALRRSLPVGQNRLGVTLVSTTGSGLQSLLVDGRDVTADAEAHQVNGRPAWTVFLESPRVSTRTVTFEVREQGTDGAAQVQVQPLVISPTTQVKGGC